jgi:hypothetical protein
VTCARSLKLCAMSYIPLKAVSKTLLAKFQAET